MSYGKYKKKEVCLVTKKSKIVIVFVLYIDGTDRPLYVALYYLKVPKFELSNFILK